MLNIDKITVTDTRKFFTAVLYIYCCLCKGLRGGGGPLASLVAPIVVTVSFQLFSKSFELKNNKY